MEKDKAPGRVVEKGILLEPDENGGFRYYELKEIELGAELQKKLREAFEAGPEEEGV